MRKNAKLPKTVGKKVRKYRKQLDLTQEDVAYKVDISRAYMGYIEQGRNLPSMELLEKIARALKVNLRDLV